MKDRYGPYHVVKSGCNSRLQLNHKLITNSLLSDCRYPESAGPLPRERDPASYLRTRGCNLHGCGPRQGRELRGGCKRAGEFAGFGPEVHCSACSTSTAESERRRACKQITSRRYLENCPRHDRGHKYEGAASAGPDRRKVAQSDFCWQNSAAHLYPIPPMSAI